MTMSQMTIDQAERALRRRFPAISARVYGDQTDPTVLRMLELPGPEDDARCELNDKPPTAQIRMHSVKVYSDLGVQRVILSASVTLYGVRLGQSHRLESYGIPLDKNLVQVIDRTIQALRSAWLAIVGQYVALDLMMKDLGLGPLVAPAHTLTAAQTLPAAALDAMLADGGILGMQD